MINIALRRAAVPLLLLLFAANAGAQVVGANDSGFHIRVEVEVPVGRDQAWQQFIHPQRWWSEDHSWFGKRANFSLQPIAGGCLCEAEGDKSVQHLVVSTVIPGERMVLLGGLGPLQAMGLHGAASFSFDQLAPGRTRVVHEYRVSGYSATGFAELAPIVASVQQLQLNGFLVSFAR